MPRTAAAAPASPGSYGLAPVAYLGDPAPGGGTFVNDFEPSAINARGEIGFTADVSTGGEGVFTAQGGHTRSSCARAFRRPAE